MQLYSGKSSDEVSRSCHQETLTSYKSISRFFCVCLAPHGNSFPHYLQNFVRENTPGDPALSLRDILVVSASANFSPHYLHHFREDLYPWVC